MRFFEFKFESNLGNYLEISLFIFHIERELNMYKEIEIKIFPDELENQELILVKACAKAKLKVDKLKHWKVIRRSVDARFGRPQYVLRVALSSNPLIKQSPDLKSNYKDVSQCEPIIIVGAGPAGYYAALELLELGFKPIVLERGKDVQARRRDLRAIQQFATVNPNSNYCFGEGGAGTYSDGKLYTRSNKRGNLKKCLQVLVDHGANDDILIDAHPHIGSNKLPKIVAGIRETIIKHGGEVHFNTLVNRFIIKDNICKGVQTSSGTEYIAKAVILATGHSARDIYNLCFKQGVEIEAKPFALGVRIEHDQSLIDELQYRQKPREEGLPAASYSVKCQINKKGVFSFCMCPGGIIVPAATAPGEIVVNGMSLSKRDSPYSNSGFVTVVDPEHYASLAPKYGPLAAMEYQKRVEQAVFNQGDGSQSAPAQRLMDFINSKVSNNLPDTSYIPGVHPGDLNEVLPDYISNNLKEALKVFGSRMPGYLTNNAQIVATESRTSSPVRIPRHKQTGEHIKVSGLFPCGEGAGYAGGIISAAMDGMNMAQAAALKLN